MSTVRQARATLDDLYRTPGKAELVGGRIEHLMATGRIPNRVAFRITRSLDDFANQTGKGEAYTDNMGFAIPELPSGRESFSPDASYYAGPMPANLMRFIEGSPTFAAEVRSTTMDPPPKPRWPTNARITSPPARQSFGTSIRWPSAFLSIKPPIRPGRSPIGAGKSRKQSPPCRVGGWRWIGFSVRGVLPAVVSCHPATYNRGCG
jgi:putative restriction endonuclease